MQFELSNYKNKNFHNLHFFIHALVRYFSWIIIQAWKWIYSNTVKNILRKILKRYFQYLRTRSIVAYHSLKPILQVVITFCMMGMSTGHCPVIVSLSAFVHHSQGLAAMSISRSNKVTQFVCINVTFL